MHDQTTPPVTHVADLERDVLYGRPRIQQLLRKLLEDTNALLCSGVLNTITMYFMR